MLKEKSSPRATIIRKVGIEAICLFTGLFSSCTETKRAGQEGILSSQLQTLFYIFKQTHFYLLRPQTEQQHAPKQNCITGWFPWIGSKRGGCNRAPSIFQFPLKWEDMSGRAKKTSICSRRSFFLLVLGLRPFCYSQPQLLVTWLPTVQTWMKGSAPAHDLAGHFLPQRHCQALWS